MRFSKLINLIDKRISRAIERDEEWNKSTLQRYLEEVSDRYTHDYIQRKVNIAIDAMTRDMFIKDVVKHINDMQLDGNK